MRKIKKPKTFKNVYFFESRQDAIDYAILHNLPTKIINYFEKGYAIQLGISASYVGPNTPDGTPYKDWGGINS